jgi:SAM-dependent methyltransferase
MLKLGMGLIKNVFEVNDCVLAKYKFEIFRAREKISFDYKYHTHDAALKYMYVLDRIQNILATEPVIEILDMGCGNGAMLNIIKKAFNIRGTGFDPILGNKKIRIYNFKEFGLQKRPIYLPINHLEFIKTNRKVFDVVIDLCAVTHFDPICYKQVNNGWKFVAENLEKLLKKNGKFISATDVAYSHNSCEFILSENLINYFSEFGTINYLNKIESNEGSNIIKNELEIEKNSPFYRIGKSGTDDIVLGVLGFQLSI